MTDEKSAITTFASYDYAVSNFAQYPLKGKNILYPAIGIVGESGELLDKIKKHWRNSVVNTSSAHEATFYLDSATLSNEQKAEIVKELGDVLWYLNAVAKELGTTLAHVASVNHHKLADRASRNVIKSTGDNR